MKRQIFKFSKSWPMFWTRLLIRVAWTALPGLLWYLCFHSRIWIQPSCVLIPNSCTHESVFPIDRLSLGMDLGPADGYSFITQDAAWTFAFGLLFVWWAVQTFKGKLELKQICQQLALDWNTIVRVICWNGFFTEAAHFISQRPRPFVYLDPNTLGLNPVHYTSFYSGHTSFVAASTTAAFLILLSRKASSFFLLVSLIAAETLTLSTAYFRVFSGRHFLTDVICGAIAGTLVAVLITRRSKHLKWL